MNFYTTLSAATLALGAALLGPGCAYTFQNSKNPLAEKEGIRRVYIASMMNGTYKPGVENLIYNAVQRALAAHGRVILVGRPEDADGLLQGTVEIAESQPGSPGLAERIDPVNRFERNRDIAAEYTAALRCSFSLLRREVVPGKRGVVWSGGFHRTKPFQTAFLNGIPGTTTALINDSEFDRILSELAVRVAEDLHESMLAVF